MNIIDKTTVGEVAAAFSNTILVFERHHIDYCCNGNQSIAEACATQGISDERHAKQEKTSARAGTHATAGN